MELPDAMFSLADEKAEQFKLDNLKVQNGEECSNRNQVSTYILSCTWETIDNHPCLDQ